jgi:cell wall-associated NlpC family hydrolase
MYPTRLVGGLISLAALLTFLLVPGALLAEPAATPAPASTPPISGATPSPDPSPAQSPSPASVLSPSPSPSATTPVTPRLTRAQKRALRRARRRARREARWQRLRDKVVRVARKQLGVPYVWGGASHGGFDCSGFTLYVYRHIGRRLPHGATDQARYGAHVSLRHLKVGDLVFWGGSGYYSHVAMYAGHGRVIQAPSAGKVVSYSGLSGAAAARRLIGK